MLNRMLALGLLIASSSAVGSVKEDIALIRQVLPSGSDIAQLQASLLFGDSLDQAFETSAKNYLIFDFNGDGRNDILVVAEQNPILVDQGGRKSSNCKTHDGEKCFVSYKTRSLNLYLQHSEGSYVLASTNDKIVLQGGYSGIGDPLLGLSVSADGVTYFSQARAQMYKSDSLIMLFLKNDLFVIGIEESQQWWNNLRSYRRIEDYRTGDVTEISQRDNNGPISTSKSKVSPRKPVPLRDLEGAQKLRLESQNNCGGALQ